MIPSEYVLVRWSCFMTMDIGFPILDQSVSFHPTLDPPFFSAHNSLMER
jgi:hypothetical protein